MLTLRIHDPFVYDSGNYCCTVETPFGSCQTDCHLEVEEIDSNLKCSIPKFKKTPVHSVVQAGETAIFSTKIESPKSSDVSWFVAGRRMSSNGDNVEVRKVRHIYMRACAKLEMRDTTNQSQLCTLHNILKNKREDGNVVSLETSEHGENIIYNLTRSNNTGVLKV